MTIGSGKAPADAALLQIKDREPAAQAADGVTAAGGLLLPRVALNGLDDFSLANLTEDQKKNHTGLLVYNVEADATRQLEKGIYQWNGTEWEKLKKISKTEGSSIKKLIYRASKADETRILSLGIFEFRMKPYNAANPQNTNPQMKLSSDQPTDKTFYWHFIEYFDDATGAMKDRWDDKDPNKWGYYFISRQETVKKSSFTDCNRTGRLLSPLERDEMWLADKDNNHIYHVQFMVLGDEKAKNSQRTYIIIAQKY
jgi:hypothetical protein